MTIKSVTSSWLVVLAVGLAGRALGQQTTRVSVAPGGAQCDDSSAYPVLSADGRSLAFHSEATNLVSGDTNGRDDVFVRDLASGTNKLVSVGSAGQPGDGDSYSPSLSEGGRRVAFYSEATNLVPGDTNGHDDVFVRDVWSATTLCASVDPAGAPADGDSLYPALSADGQQVAFWSFASNLVPGDTNGAWDVFVRDLARGITTRVSVDSSGAQSQGDAFFYQRPPALSADGRFVAFVSLASDLVPGDTNRAHDVFVHDRRSGRTLRVSVDSSGAESDSRGSFEGYPALSANGRYVAFASNAQNLVPSDTNRFADVFVHDLLWGSTTRVSVSSSGLQAALGGAAPALSADGRYVVFRSVSGDLVPFDTNSVADVFVRDRVRGTTTRVSVDSAGRQGDGSSLQASISCAAHRVAFASSATNLVPHDTNGDADVFLRELEPARVR